MQISIPAADNTAFAFLSGISKTHDREKNN